MDKTKIAVNVFNKNAQLYQNKFMDVDLYADTFDFFCNAIAKENAELLELACGPGNITKYLLNKRPDLKILGTDLAPNMIALAKINNPTAEFQLMDCRDLGITGKKPARQSGGIYTAGGYDAIMCGFCLPYLSKEESIKLIQDASTILNPEGVLYLSTMEDDYEKSGFKKGSTGEEIFMHYHQVDYLSAALTENNFKILKLQRKHSIMTDGTEVVDLILISGRY